MADIGLFLQQGWRNLWKQPGIFLFVALTQVGVLISSVGNALHVDRFAKTAPLPYLLFFAIFLFAFVFFWCAGTAGVIFMAFSIANREHVSVAMAWEVAKKYWRKIALIGLIFLACVAPFFCIFFVLSFTVPLQPARMAHNLFFFSIPLVLFSALGHFVLAGVVVRGMGVWQSLRSAWDAFSRHFVVLASMGLVLWVFWNILLRFNSIVAMLIKSGFDATALLKIDYLYPQGGLMNYTPYELLSPVGTILYSAFSAAVFMVAYVKYSQPKAALAGR
jgi:hypothetical protein